ncbi:MAG: hypothetical protein GQ534_02920, partial [Candidatus Delongbacteria bacterium]|nr:hypothetical protein [Candidatus Delongbacteria bacterium]
KSPINNDNTYIIFQETSDLPSYKFPDSKKPVSIMLKHSESGKFNKIDSSSAYNWQQGTKLQWLTNDKFIYNAFENNKYISKIYDTGNNTFQIIDSPIYDCYKDGYAVSLNFERLNVLTPDYGYRNHKTVIDFSDNTNDGIFFINLKTNEIRLLISIQDIIDLHKQNSMQNAKHMFNHIMISPDGNNFIFIHRWFTKNGERFDSLVSSDITGTNIKVLADNKIVSHCCWYDNSTVIGYLNNKSYGHTYYKIDIYSNKTTLLSQELLKYGDGHPSFYKNKMLFDSYPDRSRMRHLYVYDIGNNQIEKIGEFFEPLKYDNEAVYNNETRCDLHPKWSCDGQKIFFDSVHSCRRSLYSTNFNK